MITGIITFADPISYPTIIENYTYDNGTLTNVSQVLQPTPINSNSNLVISWVMLILGLAGIIGASIKLYDSRFEEEDSEQIQIFDR